MFVDYARTVESEQRRAGGHVGIITLTRLTFRDCPGTPDPPPPVRACYRVQGGASRGAVGGGASGAEVIVIIIAGVVVIARHRAA
jgi:hypothetical protein